MKSKKQQLIDDIQKIDDVIAFLDKRATQKKNKKIQNNEHKRKTNRYTT